MFEKIKVTLFYAFTHKKVTNLQMLAHIEK